MPFEVFHIDLRHDERNVIIRAKRARIVDHDASCIHDSLTICLGSIATTGKERDVYSRKARRSHLLDHKLAILEGHRATSRSRRSERLDLCCGEITLLEHLEHLATNDASGSCHGDNGLCGHNLVPSHVRSSQGSPYKVKTMIAQERRENVTGANVTGA